MEGDEAGEHGIAPPTAADPASSEQTAEVTVEIHKPKPWHGWREFLKELGTVALGVGIALAAEQCVEWVHWRNQVADARQAIATEMAFDVQAAIGRLKEQDCVERRLDELGQIVDAASRSGNLPPVGMIGAPPLHQWNSGVWESVLTSQAASHFPRQNLSRLASSYNYVQLANVEHISETEVWGRLSAITGPGRRFDPASEAELRRDLSLARQYGRNLAGLSLSIMHSLELQNLPYSQSDLATIAVLRDRPLTADAICRPIGAVPRQYGESTLPLSPSPLERGMKLLPKTVAPSVQEDDR